MHFFKIRVTMLYESNVYSRVPNKQDGVGGIIGVGGKNPNEQ